MNARALLSYRPLAAGASVALYRNACVQLRSRYAECGHCEAICPAGTLTVRDQKMELGAECIGCGRCVAACPTGALQAEGFSSTGLLDHKRQAPVLVECFKAATKAEVRVPCLGGLSVSRLLEIRIAAGEREVVVVDRGGCGECAAGAKSKEHPAAKSIARAQARLRDACLPERLLPRIESMPGALPAAAPRLGRRRLFRGLAGALRQEEPRGPFVPAPAPDRERVLAALGRLAGRYGGEISQKLFHRVEVAPSCTGHGVCAAGCPTGALRVDRDEASGTAVLSHSSDLCIGCGHCERVCPEKSAKLVFGGGRSSRRAVAQFTVGECSTCGAGISKREGGPPSICERCEKSRALARSAFNHFHGTTRAGGGSLNPDRRER